MVDRNRIGQSKKIVKRQGCHIQLTVKAGDRLEKVTVKAITLYISKLI